MYVQGEILCNSELLIHSNITAELQSDVLLPCNLHPTLLGSDKTADIAVVWTQRNTTTHSLLEISLQGDVRFWDHKGGRIKTFPKLSESGNFSILLQKVQLYDLSLYRCELFNGFNCSLAYQEIQLGENLCNSELLIHSNITAELQSDILLPCNFHPTLLGSDKTADIAVVWTQKNTTTHSLLEIFLWGEVRFWDYKSGRIKTFPKLSESGNFSIVLQKVQLYDLSLYRWRQKITPVEIDYGASIENPIYDTSSQSKSNACVRQSEEGEMLCSSELLIHSNITAELQSDVLLPCNFHPTLLGSDKTADIAVVWTQKNTTTHSLLEISLQGDVRFWDYKGGRIKTFPKLSESGNFSILVQKVQLYDLSLYHCELFNGFNCSIAYQEIHLTPKAKMKVHASKPRNHSNIYANNQVEAVEIYANQTN
ncbi:hypothetical protein C0J45_20636 [Silurus meridionalis]|nr:hypothetical protein C0J45_20636 [Silurus meridionalis]